MSQSERSPKAWPKFAYFLRSATCASLVDQLSLCFIYYLFLLKSLDLHIKLPAVLQETIYCVHILPPAINSLLLTLHLFVFSLASSASHMVSQLLLSSLAQNAEETILPVNIQSQSSLNGPIMGPSPKAYFWQMLQNGCSLYCTFGYDLLTCRSQIALAHAVAFG